MKNYAVFLHGENFDIHYQGKRQPVGFFTTVRVEAASEKEAANLAVKVIENDPELLEAFQPEASTAPDLRVKVIHELEPNNKMRNTGHVFFTMDEV